MDLYAKSLSRLRLRVARIIIFALRNIALDGYLDTRRNIENIYGTTYGRPEIENPCH